MRHGPTSATDARAFPLDEPLSEAGLAAAVGVRSALQGAVPGAVYLCSPALRCRQTAAAAGLEPAVIEPAIAECDFGSWAGRTLAEIDVSDSEAVRRWITDPAARPHGGESLLDVRERVGAWLGSLQGSVVAVTHAGVIKAAVVHALGAPIEAFWRVTPDPLSVTELVRRCATWELRLGGGPEP